MPGALSDARLRLVAWSVFGVCLLVATGFSLILGSAPQPPPAFGSSAVEAISGLIGALLFVLVGAIIVTHRARNSIGWLLVVAGALATIAYSAQIYALQILIVHADSTALGEIAAWFQTWIWFLIVPLLIAALLVYPTGSFRSPIWRALQYGCIVLGVGGAVALAAATWRHRGSGLLLSIADEPPPAFEAARGATVVFALMALIGLGCGLVCLVLRYREGSTDECLQIKWLAVAVGLFVVDGLWNELVPIDATWRIAISGVTFGAIPVAIGIAVLKYRLDDIEVIINRTLVYVPLLAFIGGLATALVTFSQRAFVTLTGSESDAAVVFTTLIVASLLGPIRKRLEAAVEGRFKPSTAADGATGNNVDIAALLQDPEVKATIRVIAEEAAREAVELARRPD